MFILDTGKVAGDMGAAEKTVRGVLEKNGAEVLVARPWDERRLAYPIRNQKKGLYYLTYFQVDSQKVVTIEQDFAINEMVLRLMVLKIDPKMVKVMLEVAKGEHAVALHNISEDDDGTGGILEEVGGRRRRD